MFSHKPNESQNETAGITWGFNHRKSEGSGGYEINIIVRLSVNIKVAVQLMLQQPPMVCYEITDMVLHELFDSWLT